MLGSNVLNKDDILMGTGQLFLNNINVGQLKGDVVFTPTAEYKDFEAGVPMQTIKSTKTKEGATLKATYAELNYNNIALAMGTNNITVTKTAVTSESAVLYSGTSTKLVKGRSIEDVVVTQGATPCVKDIDYKINDAQRGMISRVSTSTVISDGDTVTVSYKYLSKAVIKSGGGASIPEVPAKFIYASPDGDMEIVIDIFLGQLKGGQAITFKEDDYATNDIEIVATADTSRPAGEQLYSVSYNFFD